MEIVEAAHRVNQRQKTVLVTKILAKYGDDLTGKRFAIWGLAFKAKTDDMREAPAVDIVNALLEHGAKVFAHDPAAQREARAIWGDRIDVGDERYAVLDGADALVVCTDWNEFREPDFSELLNRLREPVVFDGRNLYDPAAMSRRGFEYHCVGRAANSR
jgi:UDPglucose 6-dehydrogenase